MRQLICSRCGFAIPIEQPSPHSFTCPSCGLTIVLGPDTLVTRSESLDLDTPPTGDGLPDVPGYELLDVLGRGGMGVVYKARHLGLKRLVALKMILAGTHAGPRDLERFRAEAKAAARLDHPRIVPIHEVGVHNGLPYFAMGLVEGGTLQARVRDGPLPPSQAAALVERLAEAVHYAHGRGVIHRDLKPGNVLVDLDGRPRISDFGLAKRVQSESGLTAAGQVLGTPSYMPPEQAAGRSDQVGPAADIYSLGAVLYCLLTGRPPFQAATALETLKQVQERDPVPPRQLNPGVPRDLETITLKCLQKQPSKRYLTAQDLGSDLRRYLNGEPILARPVRRVEKAWRWCRRKPAAAGLIAATVLLILGTFAGALWWIQNRTASELQRQQAERDITLALDEADRQLAELHAILRDPFRVSAFMNNPLDWQSRLAAAQGNLKRAETLRANAGEPIAPNLEKRLQDLTAQLNADERDRLLAFRLDQIRQQAEAVVEGKWDPSRTLSDYQAEFEKAGLAVRTGDPAALAARIQDSAIRWPLVAALDDWRGRITQDKALATQLVRIIRAADPAPWRDQAGGLLVWQKLMALDRLAAGPKGSLFPVAVVGVWQDAQAAEQLLAAGNLSPQAVVSLARVLHGMGGDSNTLLRAGCLRYPGDFSIHFNLGFVSDDLTEQIICNRTAVGIRPQSSVAHFNLAVTLADLKDLRGAVQHYLKAIEIDRSFDRAHTNLGRHLYDLKDVPGAIKHFQKAIEIDPNNHRAHAFLGLVLDKALNDLPGAVKHFEKALEIGPNDAKTHNNLGYALYNRKDLPGAIKHYRKSLEIDANSAKTHANLGDALFDLKDMPGAVEHYRKAVAIDPNFAEAHNNLGNALRELNDLPEALKHYRRAVELAPDQALPHTNVGLALQELGDLPGAIKYYRKALEIDPNLPGAHYNLGNALRDMRDLPGAVVHFRKTIEIDPNYAEAHCNLGHILRHQGRFAEALAALKQGHGLGSKQPDWRYPSAEWVKEAERFVQLDAKLAAIQRVEAHPADAAEQVELAEVCLYKRLSVAGSRFYHEAFTAQPALADDMHIGHRYHAACAAALAGAGKGEDAASLTAEQRTPFRQQARDWLRADLTFWTKSRAANPADSQVRAEVQRTLQHWRRDPDLAGVRDAAELAKLPAAERQAWQQFWKDVGELLAKAGDCPPAP